MVTGESNLASQPRWRAGAEVLARAGAVALLTGYSPAASRSTAPTKASPRAP